MRTEDEHRRHQADHHNRQAKGPRHGLVFDHLAEVDRLGFFQRLLDRGFAKLRGTEERVVPPNLEELNRAGKSIIEPRPTLLDSQGNVEVAKPHDQRTHDVPPDENDREKRETHQENQSDDPVEVEEPVERSGKQEQGDHRPDKKTQPVKGEKAADFSSQARDPRL